MEIEHFKKKIKHLPQEQILTGMASVFKALLTKNKRKLTARTMTALNKVLLRRKIATEDEIQKAFLDWMEKHELEKEG